MPGFLRFCSFRMSMFLTGVFFFLPMTSGAGEVISFRAKNRCAALYSGSQGDFSGGNATVVRPRFAQAHTTVRAELPKGDSTSDRILSTIESTQNTSKVFAENTPAEELVRLAPLRASTLNADQGIMSVILANPSRSEFGNHHYPVESLMPDQKTDFDIRSAIESFDGRPMNYVSAGLNSHVLSWNPSPPTLPAMRRDIYANRTAIDSLPITAMRQVTNSASHLVQNVRMHMQPRHGETKDLGAVWIKDTRIEGLESLEFQGAEGKAMYEDVRLNLAEYTSSPQRAHHLKEGIGEADLIVDFAGLASRQNLGEVLQFHFDLLGEQGYLALFLPTEVTTSSGETIQFTKFFSDKRQGIEESPYDFFSKLPGFKLKNLMKRSGVKFSSTEIGASFTQGSPNKFNGIVVYLQKDSTQGAGGPNAVEEVNSGMNRYISIRRGPRSI